MKDLAVKTVINADASSCELPHKACVFFRFGRDRRDVFGKNANINHRDGLNDVPSTESPRAEDQSVADDPAENV